jgi:hypothetical protein
MRVTASGKFGVSLVFSFSLFRAGEVEETQDFFPFNYFL